MGISACTPEAEQLDADLAWLAAEPVPHVPSDPRDPLARVIWVLNYDLREFDRGFAWLEYEVPEGPERTRALALMSMLGMAELGRTSLIKPAIGYFQRAISEQITRTSWGR